MALFRKAIARLRGQHGQTYVFGTGPSLGAADQRSWDDGYRVVCNTIVRDRELWTRLDPHFLVAGDAIYHFGHTRFARAFRKDLRARLQETDTLFLYPSTFDAIVRRDLADMPDRLLPVPTGAAPRLVGGLLPDYRLPSFENVLPQILLPLAFTLSTRVRLWGFDGRAPKDQLFWQNSGRHFYPEFLPDLQAAHPAFFDHYVPKTDPGKYARLAHGDALESALLEAERHGFEVRMMHKSWTPALARREEAALAGGSPP